MTAPIPSVPQFPEMRIVSLPARHLVGLSVRTSMQQATIDCPALWQQFVPWMWKQYGLAECGYACPSYGLSLDTDMQTGQFTYWAAIEVQDHFADPAQWPEGFAAITLAAGPYVGTGLASLQQLGEAYTHIYGPWAQTQRDYGLDFGGICFECYTKRYLQDGALDVFVPLRANGA